MLAERTVGDPSQEGEFGPISGLAPSTQEGVGAGASAQESESQLWHALAAMTLGETLDISGPLCVIYNSQGQPSQLAFVGVSVSEVCLL